MSRIKRVWWIVLVLAGPFCLPADGYCFEVDPYYFNVLTGLVSFDYERVTRQYSFQPNEDRKDFRQLYSLVMKGNVLSSKLIIFDAGITLRRDDISSSQTGESSTRLLDYNLRTTMLPKSAIPLTLYGNRFENKGTGQLTQLTSTTTNYGLNWFGKFRTLPATRLAIDKTENKGASTRSEQTTYTVNATKDIGITKNEINYKDSTTADRVADKAYTDNTISYGNTTKISRDTVMRLGATREIGLNQSTGYGRSEGYSLNLVSNPSREFKQIHSYTTYSIKNDINRQEGGTYDGQLNYAFSKRLTAAFALNIFNSSSSSATSKSKSEDISSNGDVRYTLTGHWSISEQFTYSKTKTSDTSNTKENLFGREALSDTTNLNYVNTGEWLNTNGTYGLGYMEDHLSNGKGGSGTSERLSLMLSKGRHEFDYVGLSSSVSYSHSKSFSTLSGAQSNPHIWLTGENINLAAYNKIWKKYLALIGTYNESISKSWDSISDSKVGIYKLEAESNFLKNTRAKASVEHENAFRGSQGFIRRNAMQMGFSHSRGLLGGTAVVGYDYQYWNTFYKDGGQAGKKTDYSAKYNRFLPGNTSWAAALLWSEDVQNGVTTVKKTVTNSFKTPLLASFLLLSHKYEAAEDYQSKTTTNTGTMAYQLRAWFVSVEDSYSNTESTGTGAPVKSSVNTFLVRASRGFRAVL